MRHRYFGRKLSRTTNERKRLFQVLVRDLVKHSSIKTTLAKAKAVQPIIEKAITRAKKPGQFTYRILMSQFNDKDTVVKLIEDAKDRFVNRSSGYTRIVKLGLRPGDASTMVAFSFVDAPVIRTPVAFEEKPASIKTTAGKQKTEKTEKPMTNKKAKPVKTKTVKKKIK